ncbi:MAG: hypothetical protein ACRDFZ_03050 [Candidatus Limnocylindria bacterium]
MNEAALPLLALAIGLVGAAAGVALIRSSGANTGAGRRLAGAPAMSLRELQDLATRDQLPTVPVRVEGRVRCANPLTLPGGERLAALHRDVGVELPDGGWRVIERVREARAIDLWERAASVPIDLAELAEPLITIPEVWEGSPSELADTYRAAVDRVATELGPPRRARATTRQLSVADQLIILALPGRDESGRLQLRPPGGGFLAANVELDTAMRLLAGPHRSRMLAGFAFAAIGAAIAGLAAIGLLVALSG